MMAIQKIRFLKIAVLMITTAAISIVPVVNVNASSSPSVFPISFVDDNGTSDPSDDTPITMSTGYSAERVASDDDANIYVSDPVAQTIYVFDKNALLIKYINSVHVPLGIAVSSIEDSTTIYASGYINGHGVYTLDHNGTVTSFLGLGALSGNFSDMAVSGSGELFLLDKDANKVKVISKAGAVDREFGPYDIMVDSPLGETINGYRYYRTSHKMKSPAGIAIDESKREVYVSVRELVMYLNSSCFSSNCYKDLDAYKEFTSISTGSNYIYWEPLAERYRIMVLDMDSGDLKDTLISLSSGYLSLSSTSSSAVLPNGLSVDPMGRLYVATTSGIKIFDTATGSEISVSGQGFSSGIYKDVEYKERKSGGILYALSSNKISVYSIDGGIVYENTPPDAPTLIAPPDRTYVTSLTPSFEIGNASDIDGDTLSYGYEIKDQSEAIVASASFINQGENGKTIMAVSTSLAENSKYKWRAKASDASSSSWSLESEFCVNQLNENPETPAVVSPAGGEAASPFSTSLVWTSSKDPDCYDTVSYVIEISDDPGFATTLLHADGISGASIRIRDLKNYEALKNGVLYFWRLKAEDGKGGQSAYGTGSFTYRTTTVRFESDLPDAKVYMDGNYGYFGRQVNGKYDESGKLTDTITLPLEVQNISVGSHFVTFVKADYEPYYKLIEIKDPLIDNGTLTVSARSDNSYNPSDKWVKATRINASDAGTELININGSNTTPFLVDYNNDGIKDIVAGGAVHVYDQNGGLTEAADGKVYLYLGREQVQADGTRKIVLTDSVPIKADGVDINIGARATPFIVDYNNDGKKDLLLGSSAGYIYLYLNAGDDKSPVFTASGKINAAGGEIKLENTAPSVIDYNNDGKKDLVLGSADGYLRLYLNTGADAVPVFEAHAFINADYAVLGAGSNSKPFFTDWNSDGKKDLIVGRGTADGDGNTANLYFNIGSDRSPEFTSISGLQAWIKKKKKELSSEYLPYVGYNNEPGDISGGVGEAAPFIANWGGTTARDAIVGNGEGRVILHTGE